MKTIICDMCSEGLHEPFVSKMTQFIFAQKNDGYIIRRKLIKRKKRIHLCEKCLHALCDIQKSKRDGSNQ